MRQLLILPALIFLAPALAQDPGAPPPPPMREPMPPKVHDPDEELAPEVIIRQEEGRTVEEYRHNGQIYMVKITPVAGPAYYLIDTTGDGHMDTRHDPMAPVKPAHWRLFEW